MGLCYQCKPYYFEQGRPNKNVAKGYIMVTRKCTRCGGTYKAVIKKTSLYRTKVVYRKRKQVVV